MVLLDTVLKRRAESGNPIRVGMFGAGCLGRGLARQIVQAVPGIRLAAIWTRDTDSARTAYENAGIDRVHVVKSPSQLDDAISRGVYSICDSPDVICRADAIDAVLDVTGSVLFGAEIAFAAIQNGKHFVGNAELDATLGPILKVHADRNRVVFTSIDGDQPGTQMNLVRFVKGIGLRALVCGNIKTLQDPYRTPATQADFASRWGLSSNMATQFADGSKISFEQTSVANATGMRVAKRGMLGTVHEGHVDELRNIYDRDELEAWGGIVDYALGAKPSPGVYVIATADDRTCQKYLQLYKMGDGPLYTFYAPYHLAHFEAPSAIGRAVLFRDAVIAPANGPTVEVIATAKRDLQEGEALDGIGQFMTYGQCENSDVARSEHLLPMGLAKGCRLRRSVKKDAVLAFEDVIVPEGRTCDRLWADQLARFGTAVLQLQ
jgi:predicted homoserine dehydrogenase-like protein